MIYAGVKGGMHQNIPSLEHNVKRVSVSPTLFLPQRQLSLVIIFFWGGRAKFSISSGQNLVNDQMRLLCN